MIYDFDEVIDRKGTHTYKMDVLPEGSPPDALPLWVADMDLPCAEPVIQALHERIDKRIFGYTTYDNQELKDAVKGWFSRRYQWQIDEKWILFSSGVVPAIAFLLNALTEEGDGIIIQRPVYYPFTKKIEANNRVVVNNPLIRHGSTYVMDFGDLEKKFSEPKNKGMILCSPHNPVGRVWNKEELKKIIQLAVKYDKWIIADEIHCDLTRRGIVNIPMMKLAEEMNTEYRDRIITCTAPSKTFNLAGAGFSNIIIPNEEYRKKWIKIIDRRFSSASCSPFGLTAAIAAYNEGEEWLEQVRTYLDGNIEFAEQFIKNNMPKAELIECQGTYLLWVDLRKYCNDSKKLEELMQKKAKVALDEGYIFGEEGEGYERINIATQRKTVENCLKRMKKALESL